MTRTWFARRRGTRLRMEHLEDRLVPSTFTVNTTLDAVNPTDGQLSLREAIIRANTHAGADVILLPTGVFKITLDGANENANATGDFDVTDAVTIRGAGAGITVMDAQQKDRLFDVVGSFVVKFVDVTLRHGNGPNNGAAVQAENADLTLVRCTVTDNTALVGGGINADRGNVTLIDSTVARNVSQGVGGGIHTGTGILTMSGSTVRRNLSGGQGGGIDATTATVKNSTVSGNSALQNGGGIRAGTATLTNSTVSGNFARNGGGILADSATLTSCTVSGNSAGIDAGGIGATTANLTNCTISGNFATNQGGGIFAITTATLLNCTITENSAHTGGGLFHNLGAGIFDIRNTIVALNLVDFSDAGPDVSGSFTSQGHNLIGNGTGGAGFTDGTSGDIVGTSATPVDPKLGPLVNNGGRTQTHKLQAGSPAIDAGDNAGAPVTDQRGLPRKKDGNGDGVAIVDIGSFER